MKETSVSVPRRPHDRSQRLLFHHRRPVKDLMRGFVHEPWIHDLDFRTLKRLPSDYLSGAMPGEYEERLGDVLWEVRWRRRQRRQSGRGVCILVLIELQSTCPEDMVLRVASYVFLGYQRLLKERPLRKGERLPMILPIIAYNGDDLWDAPLDVSDLIESVPESLAPHVPSMRCLLIDEKHCRQEDLTALRENVMAAICRAEQSTAASLGGVVQDLVEWLNGPWDRELCRDLLAWFAKVLVPLRCPDAEIPELRDLRDLLTYVETDMPNWIEEAKAEGRQEGQAELILRQIEHKFSPVPDDVKARILSAEIDDLLRWTDRILTAEALSDVFGGEEPGTDAN